MKFKIITGGLGIIDGYQKKALESYVDARLITQRKQFDEYYVEQDTRKFDLDIKDLSVLSEDFTVEVSNDEIFLSDPY